MLGDKLRRNVVQPGDHEMKRKFVGPGPRRKTALDIEDEADAFFGGVGYLAVVGRKRRKPGQQAARDERLPFGTIEGLAKEGEPFEELQQRGEPAGTIRAVRGGGVQAFGRQRSTVRGAVSLDCKQCRSSSRLRAWSEPVWHRIAAPSRRRL